MDNKTENSLCRKMSYTFCDKPSNCMITESPLQEQENIHRHFSDFSPLASKTRRAKRIRFLCNGDKFFKGHVMAVTNERYRSFDSLLVELTRVLAGNINLPSGVRTIYTLEGQKITNIDDLEDGKMYLCSGNGDQFKKVDYALLTANSPSSNTFPRKSAKLPLINKPSKLPIPTVKQNDVRPRIILVIRSGQRPRKVLRVLLNKRNAPSLEQCFATITEAVKLDSGAVRKVFSFKGSLVQCLADFFRNDDIFYAFGSERVQQDDLEVDFEEIKAIQSLKKDLRRTDNFLKKGTTCLDERGQEVPKMPTKSNIILKRPNTSHVPRDTTPKKKDFLRNIPNRISSRYVIGDIIGDGNFAVVRKVHDKQKDMYCALKIIDKSKLLGKDQKVENEVSILRSVEHPNIIKLLDECDTPTELYLVMELLRGGDLFDAILVNVKYPEDEAKFMTYSLASALAYLHENCIVHRDIKPENLLVEMKKNRIVVLKVGDFGLAQRVYKPMFAVCGTPTYVAPEILTENGYGLKIDVWAAGVILYILLCGFPPFVSDKGDQDALFDDILSGQYGFPSPYWDNISDEAKDLVSHMLESNPDLRFSAEDVLDHPWLEYYNSR